MKNRQKWKKEKYLFLFRQPMDMMWSIRVFFQADFKVVPYW
jgi:hypothetical protein